MKFLQNKIVIGGGCILLAAVFAFMLLPNMYKNKGGTEKIIKVNTTVVAGTKIDEAMLVEAEVGSYGLPDNVVKNKDEVVGKYSKTDITPDDMILKTKISEFAANEKLDNILASGKKLITITLPSIAAGVGNHLQAGDIITLVYYAENAASIAEEMKNIEVYSIENDDAINVEDAPNGDEDVDHIAATLTLIVTDIQAEKLVNAEYSGKLHAVFERRGN